MPRIVLAGVFLPVAILGALVLSASATVDLFTSQGVSPGIVWAAVLMVEVTVLSGTLLWLLVRSSSLRRDARLVTFGATAVTLVAGWHAYGAVGLTAGVGAVAVTHLASRAWREPWSESETGPDESGRTVADVVAESAAETPEGVEPVNEVPPVDDAAAGEAGGDERPESDEPTAEVVDIHRAPQPPEKWPYGDRVWRQAVDFARAGNRRPRLVRRFADHGMSQNWARKVLEAVDNEGRAA